MQNEALEILMELYNLIPGNRELYSLGKFERIGLIEILQEKIKQKILDLSPTVDVTKWTDHQGEYVASLEKD